MSEAIRVDDVLGIVERAAFIGPGARRMFAFVHGPQHAARGRVLVCSPILADFTANYYREVLLGRLLARRGFVACRFHYRSTGNSDGEDDELTFETLRSDAEEMLEYIDRMFGPSPTAFVGTRIGSLVAAAAAVPYASAPVALWAPVVRADRYFREGLRAMRARSIEEGTAPEAAGLSEQLEAGGSVDIVGHLLTRPLYESLVDRGIVSELVRGGQRPILLFQLARSLELRDDVRSLGVELTARGFDVATHAGGPHDPWWFDQFYDPAADALCARTADWIESRLVGS